TYRTKGLAKITIDDKPVTGQIDPLWLSGQLNPHALIMNYTMSMLLMLFATSSK
ncbi:hypothetical protein L9F63_025176, partial [Diploptera punctata]